MKKLLSLFLAVALMAGLSVPAFADIVFGDAGGENRVSRTVETTDGTFEVTGTSYPDEAKEVLRIMNLRRAEAGLKALTWKEELVEPAITRALEQELLKSHTRPNGTEWSTVSPIAYGENLAGGDTSASAVMVGWMNSPPHKKNILDADFTGVAVACVKTESMTYWVQLFYIEGADASKVKDYSSGSGAASPGQSGGAAAQPSKPQGTVSSEIINSLNSAANNQAATAVANVNNVSVLSPATVQEMAAWSKSKNKPILLVAGTTMEESSAVQGQLRLNPLSFSSFQQNLKLGVYTEESQVAKMKTRLAAWYSNELAIIKMEQAGALPAQVQVVAKVDLGGLDTKNLTFYVYNPDTNTISKIQAPSYSLDPNGYLYFNTAHAGTIVVTNGELKK